MRATEGLLLSAARLVASVHIDPAYSAYDICSLILLHDHSASRTDISLELTHLDFMDVLPTGLANAATDVDAAWLTHTDLQDWLCTDGTFFKGAFFIRAFGYRYESDNRTGPHHIMHYEKGALSPTN